ncbi:tetratricopeptide repeat protein, partial [Magnetospirillum sp. UT-4]|uniref:tetratricopeptide repeat protein n=1 Tax=Magnetospirillum sp. UT-4 TaxID=2681467 RepID=UPI001572A24C
MRKLMTTGLLAAGLLIGQVSASTAGPFEDGVQAHNRGDFALALTLFRSASEVGHVDAQLYLADMYESGRGVTQDFAAAMRWYRISADQGDHRAQLNLGVMYERGRGVPQDLTEAVRWYRKAAADKGEVGAAAQSNLGDVYATKQDWPEAAKWYRMAADQGHAWAQFNLGLSYHRGQGVAQNYSEAAKWYRMAADQGHARAQFNLGLSYHRGQGVAQNYSEAVKWCRMAADQGHATAQFNLGLSYHRGQGVAQNYSEAAKWYRMAADQGDAHAQFNLGLMYWEGLGVPKDYVAAYNWLILASTAENDGAGKLTQARDKLASKLSGAQIASAQQMAREWRPKAEDSGITEPSQDNGHAAPVPAEPRGGLLDDIRNAYPVYGDLSDSELAEGLYRRFYATKMSRADFDRKVGLAQTRAPEPFVTRIQVPTSLRTETASVEVTGKVTRGGRIVSLTVDGSSAPFKADGRFSFKRAVPIGETVIRLVATDEWGQTAAATVTVTRTTPTTTTTSFAALDPGRAKAKQRANAVALIIGVDGYQSIPRAEFAENDARRFYDYATNALARP